LKKDLAEIVVEFATPFQERFATFAGDVAELDRLLADGAARATELAQPTLIRVYERVGLLPPRRTSG
jgi:tryptophanyl-tRNA synthetase